MEFNDGGGEMIEAPNGDRGGAAAMRSCLGAKIADLSRFWSSIDTDPGRARITP
jgi:ribulose 1,5-bisphosphate carboxylase large subunit-like protein